VKKVLSTRSLLPAPALDGANGRRHEAAAHRGLEHAQPTPKARPKAAVLRIRRYISRTTPLEPFGPPDCGQEGSAEGCMVYSLGISRAMWVRMALQGHKEIAGVRAGWTKA
jgi:hypothetical protein